MGIMSHDPIRFRLIVYLILIVVILLGGTIGFKFMEGRSWIDALYFITVTVATVGYGDVTPVTFGGKIVTIFLIFLGVGTFLGVFANAAEMMLHRQEKTLRMKKLNMVIVTAGQELGQPQRIK